MDNQTFDFFEDDLEDEEVEVEEAIDDDLPRCDRCTGRGCNYCLMCTY